MPGSENVHAVVGRRKGVHTNLERVTEDDDIDVLSGEEDSDRNNEMTESMGASSTRNLTLTMTLPTRESAFSSTTATQHMQDRMRRALKYYFMSPLDKWKAKGRLPWKMALQVVKIVFVTLQISIFGIHMSEYLTLQGNMDSSLRQLFLMKWDPLREVMSYPPEAGPFAVYNREDFYKSIDYAIHQFANITDISIGFFGYKTSLSKNGTEKKMSIISFCQKYYATGIVNPSNFSYKFDNLLLDACVKIDNLFEPGDVRWNDFGILGYLNNNVSFPVDFDRLLVATLHLPLRIIYLNSVARTNPPECYESDVALRFDNSQHSGQILVSLSVETKKQQCDGNLKDNEEASHIELQALNWLVIILSCLSTFLCCRSLIRGQSMRHKTVYFFRKHFGIELSFQDKMMFVDGWILMIILNDLLIISGSIFKTIMEQNSLHGPNYNYCALLLGVGNLLVWCGFLRYLAFFDKYNVLIVTLKHTLPNVLRFLFCALIVYGGFCFCGWLVLGPHHIKFRTLSMTSECLFALMNGDDVFATFAITDTQSMIVWWFSRLYLYGFIILFIYVVISLFIAIIMDSYETIKSYYITGFPLSDLQKFISECHETSDSFMFRNDDQNSNYKMFDCFTSLRRRIQTMQMRLF